MLIIPAIDIHNGRCVRFVQGDAQRELWYGDDPVAAATAWVTQGAPWLHVADLSGALAGHPVHLDLIRAIVTATPVPVQVGGGFRTLDDIDAGLATGAARVLVGTAALTLRAELGRKYGERVAVSLDVKDGKLAVSGWTRLLELDPVVFAQQLVADGVRRFIVTSVSRDGTLTGPDLEGMRAFVGAVNVPVIAAGGIGTNADVLALAALGVEGVIVGRALYEGRVDLPALLGRGAAAC